MNIAIIGTGNVGGALAYKWAKAGHHIHLGLRSRESFKRKHLLQLSEVQAHSIKEAVAVSEVVLIATPATTVESVAKGLGDTNGKVLIDAMNIVRGNGPEGFQNTADALKHYTEGAEVVKCFNTTGFNNMLNPLYGDQKLDAFVAGDSQRGKDLASQLALDAGFAACYDIGGDANFSMMEQFARFWINLAMVQGHGREIGFKLLKREE
ncbi:NAD(P)-binding domain-containing protein [Cryomorphaceae bacterium]|nr:NAD(P)-binding domain-containing protein [Cryomorphaceae bacterium]